MRAAYVALIVVILGQRMLAQDQAFNRRYDLFGQQYGQFAYSIEQNGADGYAVVANTNYDDSVYLYITAALIRLNAQAMCFPKARCSTV